MRAAFDVVNLGVCDIICFYDTVRKDCLYNNAVTASALLIQFIVDKGRIAVFSYIGVAGRMNPRNVLRIHLSFPMRRECVNLHTKLGISRGYLRREAKILHKI